DLLQAGTTDRLARIARTGAADKGDRRSLDRRAKRVREQLIAALGLALERNVGRQCLRETARNFEQLRPIAALELELDFAQWGRAASRIDLAVVDGERDRARAIGQRIDRTLDARLEHRLELAPKLAVDQRLERGVAGQAQVWILVLDLAFPFVALEQATVRR